MAFGSNADRRSFRQARAAGVRLAACVGLAVLLSLCAAGPASALPGSDLIPIRGMAYQPAPSDYTGNGAGVYYDSDFFNDDFKKLWSTADGGRGDLHMMASELHVNLLHLYDWNRPPLRNHLSFLNEALANGIRVAVPISNYFVRDDPTPAEHIEAIVREVYSDAQGNPTTVPHPAVAMWTISNEYDYNNISPQQAAQAAAYLVAAEQKIGATKLLPVSVPVSFGVYPPSPDPGVTKTLDVIAALNAQAGLPQDFVSTRFIAATNPQNPGSFIADWLPKFKQQVPNTSLWFSELGTAVEHSCNGYPQPCTPSEQQQATFNGDEWKASAPGAQGILLGGAQFEFQNEPWKGGPDATFGILKFVPNSYTTVETSWKNPDPNGPTPLHGTYRVDQFERKPSWYALQKAFGVLGFGLGAPIGLGGGAIGDGGAVGQSVEAANASNAALAGTPGTGACDPLLAPCGPAQPEQPAPTLAPSDGDEGGGGAVGPPRMPNLRARANARWESGTVEVRVRVSISKPGLVRRSFFARVSIPSLGETRQMRFSARGKRVHELSFTAPRSVIGKRVIVTVDPTDRVLEARERDNTASANIR